MCKINDLIFLGNKDILKKKSVAIVGSRHSSESYLEIAKECAAQAVRNRYPVISGNANGIDLEAHYSALRAGGETIMVLPEGVENFYIKPKLKSVWDWDRVLVISEFLRNEKWSARNAMLRNKTIIDYSIAVIAIFNEKSKGTLNLVKETRKLKKTFFPSLFIYTEDNSIRTKFQWKAKFIPNIHLVKNLFSECKIFNYASFPFK